jgi:hypothetical protein
MIEAWFCTFESDTATADGIIVKDNSVVKEQRAGPFTSGAMITLKFFNYRSGSEFSYTIVIYLHNDQFESQFLCR